MDPVVTLKRSSPVDCSLCIFCQTPSVGGFLGKASDHGLATAKHAASIRRKLRHSKNIVVIDRLENDLNSDEKQSIAGYKYQRIDIVFDRYRKKDNQGWYQNTTHKISSTNQTAYRKS